MGTYSKLKALIEKGRTGGSAGIPTGVPKYDQFVFGTRQGCYFLYGGETGSGKTKFVREAHIYEMYDVYKRINDTTKLDVRFLDFSLEITGEENMANLYCRKLYKDTGCLIGVEKLLSWKGVINDEEFKQFEGYEEYFTEFEDKVITITEECTPSIYHNTLLAYAKANGTFEFPEETAISNMGSYTPDNPNLYTIIVMDTINLTDLEKGQVVKQSIDRISRISVWFRNVCNFTPIIIQQFNAEIAGTDRGRYGVRTPMLRDYEDSKRCTKDANVVVGLFDPMRHNMEEFNGYNILVLKSWFRSLHILKNRNGEPNKWVPLKFSGAISSFEQMPNADVMGEMEYTETTRL